MVTHEILTHEFEFFKARQEELVAQYRGKYAVIVGETVIGAYDTPLEAYLQAQERHELGTFLIQVCNPGPEAYTTTITSLGLVEIAA
jgi:hypothetical protein